MKITQEIIDELKSNKIPFGLMDKTLKNALREMGKKDAICYTGRNAWPDATVYTTFFPTKTYRIRGDFELAVDMCGMVSSPVFTGTHGTNILHYQFEHEGEQFDIDESTGLVGFVGIEYEGDEGRVYYDRVKMCGKVDAPKTMIAPTPIRVWFKKEAGE